MNILALEFSSEKRSVAVLPAGGAGIDPATASILATPRTLNAFRLIETALSEARLEREQIDCLAVGLGPGSYTGIRAAISIAQAWQLASGAKLFGISSVECLAWQAQANGVEGHVSCIIDAQRNEFYVAAYEIEPGRLTLAEPLRLASFSEVGARAEAGAMLVGPDADRWFPGARAMFSEAGTLAKLAAGRNDFAAGETLQPIYLRETSFVKACWISSARTGVLGPMAFWVKTTFTTGLPTLIAGKKSPTVSGEPSVAVKEVLPSVSTVCPSTVRLGLATLPTGPRNSPSVSGSSRCSSVAFTELSGSWAIPRTSTKSPGETLARVKGPTGTGFDR